MLLAVDATFRLVLFRGAVSKSRSAVQGALYSLDAGPFTQPLWTFEIASDQELPFVESGATVIVDGPVAEGSRPAIVSGGVTIRPRSGLRRGVGPGMARTFATRGEVIVHPGLSGWEDKRRFVRPLSMSSPSEVQAAFVCQSRWVLGVAGLGAVILAVAWGVWASRETSGRLVYLAVVGLMAVLGGIAGSVRLRGDARRYREVCEATPVSERPMVMKLVWLAGAANNRMFRGPVAEAHLMGSDSDSASHGRGKFVVRVLNVAPGLVGRGDVAVNAYFDDSGRVCGVHVSDAMLRPIPVVRGSDSLGPYR
jgi:hypothetical protein